MALPVNAPVGKAIGQEKDVDPLVEELAGIPTANHCSMKNPEGELGSGYFLYPLPLNELGN